MPDVFVSYVSENTREVDRLCDALVNQGVEIWRDKEKLKPGDRFKDVLRTAIQNIPFFLACFSEEYTQKSRTYMNEELSIAVEDLRLRHPSHTWFIPVRISECEIPNLPIGGGAYLGDLYRVDLFRDWNAGIEKILEVLREELPAPGGIVSLDLVRAYKKRLPGEVFVIELLNEPIELKRDRKGGITITVDRRTATHCVISNAGKQKIIDDRITGRDDVIKKLDGKDYEIQRFLTGEISGETSSEQTIFIKPEELGVPLRWASGGVLSLVRFKEQEWIPLFFRDIPPYGWNLSLGSTERRFDRQGQWDEEGEHRHPWDLIQREFVEESIVINPAPDEKDADKLYTFRQFVPMTGSSAERWKAHIYLRQTSDELKSAQRSAPIKLTQVQLKPEMALRILSSSLPDRPQEPDPPEYDVLVCFSLRDLGIEVVRVCKYDLQDDDYLLDGEIYRDKHLVRMPMALFSSRYLEQTFTDEGNWYHYTARLGEPPSIEVRDPPDSRDVVLFPWDIERRMKIISGQKRAEDHERERFREWLAIFGCYFLDGDGQPSLANPSRLFVPGTAKILNMYFTKYYRRGAAE